ncbi:MAG: hypothetical protein AAF602_15595 [Myxococcota bacterium]
MTWRTVWPHLRAVLIVLHVAVITFHAMPTVGGGLSRTAWKTPTVQGEFRAWSERLQGLGFDVEIADLEDPLWAIAVGWEKGRRTMLKPVMPYLRYCGTYQSWRMFVAPHRYPGRLHIDIDRGSGWEPIYVARSPEHAWRRHWLDHDRFRAAIFRYAWKHFRKGRAEFANWVTRRVERDYPDAERVRVSFMRYRTRSPEEVRAGTPADEKRVLTSIRRIEPP